MKQTLQPRDSRPAQAHIDIPVHDRNVQIYGRNRQGMWDCA